MKNISILISVFTFCFTLQAKNQKNKTAFLLKGASYILAPIVPPSFLLATPAEIKNRKDVRRTGLSGSASLVQANGQSNIGVNLEYALGTSLNYWALVASQYQFLNNAGQTERLQSLGAEYRFFPYKKFQFSSSMVVESWETKSQATTSTDTGVLVSFPISYTVSKRINLFYSPGFRYQSSNTDLSGELRLGLSTKIIRGLLLRASFTLLISREGREDEGLSSVNVGLSI